MTSHAGFGSGFDEWVMNQSQMTEPGVTVGAVLKVTTTERSTPAGVPPGHRQSTLVGVMVQEPPAEGAVRHDEQSGRQHAVDHDVLRHARVRG